MTKLGKFCLYTPIKVLIVSTIISYIVFILGISLSSPSYPHHGCDMSGIVYGMIIFINIFSSILSYTIAFNFYKSVRDQSLLCFCSFYGFFILLFMVSLIPFASESIILALVAYLPFLIPQTFYYIRFKKRLKSGEILDDYYEETVNCE